MNKQIDDCISEVFREAWWDMLNSITKTAVYHWHSSIYHWWFAHIIASFLQATNINSYYADVGGDLIDPIEEPHHTKQTPHHSNILAWAKFKLLPNRLNTRKSTTSEDFPTWVSADGSEDNVYHYRWFPRKWKRAETKPLPKISTYLSSHLIALPSGQALTGCYNSIKSRLAEVAEYSQYAYSPKIGTTESFNYLMIAVRI